jgi:EAL domain-containing protein (putative c-di-GMP-specific phosphodiesterase class I)
LNSSGDTDTASSEVRNSHAREVQMDATAKRNQLDIVDDVERGLAQNEFFLVFQPKLRVPEETLSGFEALLRWRHPVRGILMPSSFIRVVESSRLSGRFTDFLLARAAETLADWAACGYGSLSLAINLPVRELAREDLPGKLVRVLAAQAIDTAKLQIELTETTEPGPLDELVAAVDSVRATGVRVAIDDFGAGYWSLGLLHRLAVEVLKIDRCFISDIPVNARSTVLLEALVRLGQLLGKQIVIEGIETEAQFVWAKSMPHVDCQGYYISMPVHAAQIDELVMQHGLVSSSGYIQVISHEPGWTRK